MTSRLALLLSILAILAAVAGVVMLGRQVARLSTRVAALERREPAPPPVSAPPAPTEPPAKVESREEMKRKAIRRLIESENRAQLDMLAKNLKVEAAVETRIRAAFTDEFEYYIDEVLRSLDALQTSETPGNLLENPEFRKGLEERIAATDEKVRESLNAFQTAVFEQWRRDLRKDRYELD